MIKHLTFAFKVSWYQLLAGRTTIIIVISHAFPRTSLTNTLTKNCFLHIFSQFATSYHPYMLCCIIYAVVYTCTENKHLVEGLVQPWRPVKTVSTKLSSELVSSQIQAKCHTVVKLTLSLIIIWNIQYTKLKFYR
jgi:hypothetical protein